LIDDRINLITKDKADKLWIATESGLCYYDYVKNRFFNYLFGNNAVMLRYCCGNKNYRINFAFGAVL